MMDGKQINEQLNYWIDHKIMLHRGIVSNWYQMTKRVDAGEIFRSETFSRILFTEKDARDLFDSFFRGDMENRMVFTSDDMGMFGMKNNYYMNQAVYEGKFIKFTRLVKPILYIQN